MHAQAGSPIRMADIAAAAGCSVRTLTTVFRRFRDTTPLAALHTIRLDKVRADLRDGRANGSVASVARAYGFTHAGRFTVAYRRRFGEAPTSRR
jgi:transcriptional regulator GlxA family with amidase domain